MFRTSLALGAAVLLVFGASAANASGWGGYYIGLHAGQGEAESTTSRDIVGTDYFAASSITAIESASAMLLDEETFTGGAQVGVNWPMFGDHFFIGAEIDASGFGNDTSVTSTVTYPCCGPSTFTVTNSVEQTWFATARLRMGLTVDFGMLYATGGFAGSQIKFTQTFSDTYTPIPLQVIENDEFRSGYAVGGGIEIMIESGCSLRAEYLYLDLGDIENSGAIAVPTDTSNGRAEMTDVLLRAGINFQMN